MKRLNLHKIYASIVVLVVVMAILFGYVFPSFHAQSEEIALRYSQKAAEYKALEAEQKSYEDGQVDLVNLSKLEVKPGDLFSQDTRLVKEIETLEKLASARDLDMTLHISGTVNDAKPVPETNSSLVLIPYTITLIGQYGSIVGFMEEIEHTSFVTHIRLISFVSITDNQVRATLEGNFFVKK